MLYQNGNVTVDESFARFGSKSYAIDKINSVDVKMQKKEGCLWVITGIIAFLALMAGLGSLNGESAGASSGSFVVAAIFVGITVLAYRGRPKPIYHLILATSSGEVQAYSSIDSDAIGELRHAIESAMSGRLG